MSSSCHARKYLAQQTSARLFGEEVTPLRFFRNEPRFALLTFALTLRMTELMLDSLRTELNLLFLVLLVVGFIAIHVECTTTIVEPVLDCLVESSIYL